MATAPTVHPIDAALFGMVGLSTSLPADSWWFISSGSLDAGETHLAETGAMYYRNSMVSIGAALRVRGWVFCAERLTMIPQAGWQLGAFVGNAHYTMGELEVPPGFKVSVALLARFMSDIMPITSPDAAPDDMKHTEKPRDEAAARDAYHFLGDRMALDDRPKQ